MPEQEESQKATESQLNSDALSSSSSSDLEEEEEEEDDALSSSSSSSSEEYEYEEPEDDGQVHEPVPYRLPDDEIPESENIPEVNVRLFSEALRSKELRKAEAEEARGYISHEERFDFPEDPEKWREEDLREHWADAHWKMSKPGWDPVWADKEDWDVVDEEIKDGKDPVIAPYYVPYRRPYPAIPKDLPEVRTPKAVIQELDRIEEFLRWVSYIFPDGSSYEGTVWDDLAHGRGVYVAEQGLVRYEGEWLQNNMEGHGVVEVDIPDIEPIPGSKLEEEMRAEGHIISRDYMNPEDREWLEMDIEDSIQLTGGTSEIPFYEKDEWIEHFGEKPEKGRYRYAGQWKHSRMHGCGVYEVNEQTIYGRFYFGELLEDSTGCDEDTTALHAGIAEVAAGKARMFVNKPDGMVREERGPYSDPQHPYLYEEEDVWMAPGFINQFYEVPDYWKTYVHEVDEEREMWLNSFYKAPLRLPMPSELQYWWENEETPEFVLVNKEPEPDPEDPSKLIYTEDPLILHTRTGRLINYINDDEHGVRLFWQPSLEDGEEVDPEKVELLPVSFDDGRYSDSKEQNVSVVETKSISEKFDEWIEEKKKASEVRMKLIEKELELVEAELCLEEVIEDMDEELKMKEEEDEENVETGLKDEENTSPTVNQDEKLIKEDEEEQEEEEEQEDEEEEDDDGVAPSSFGSIGADQDGKNGEKGNKPGGSPFSTSSLAFASSSFVSGVPSRLQQSFMAWKSNRAMPKAATSSCKEATCGVLKTVDSVSFSAVVGPKVNLKAIKQRQVNIQAKNKRLCQLRPSSQINSCHSTSMNTRMIPKEIKWGNHWLHAAPERELDGILSLHTSLYQLEPKETLHGKLLTPLLT